MSTATKTAPKRGTAENETERRIAADFPAAHFDAINTAAIEGERTIPGQIRLIVREWFMNQNGKVE